MRRPRWLNDLLAMAWPVALYGVSVLLGLLAFTGTIAYTNWPISMRDVVLLAGMYTAALVGVVGGQVLSATRVRSTFAMVSLFASFVAGLYVIANLEHRVKQLLGAGADFMLMFLLLAPIMATGGFWSLRVNRGLAASWAPMLLFVASILTLTNHSDRVLEWHAGSKYAIWSIGTFALLGLAVIVQLVYMAGRERHRLHRWRTAPVAPELVDARPDPFRPFAGVGTLVMLTLLVAVLTLGSALLAPYLWRTGPGDRDGEGPPIEEPVDEPVDGDQPADAEPADGDGGGGGGGMNGEKLIEYLQQGVNATCALMTMLVLALVALVVFGPPTRRLLLLSHLRDPMWPVPPSLRARLHWRLAEIALGDAGVHRQPGETARDVALRGVARMPGVNLDALVTAAEIADRVAYGYAMDATDADTIGRAAEMTYHAVWDTLGEGARLRATYRWL